MMLSRREHTVQNPSLSTASRSAGRDFRYDCGRCNVVVLGSNEGDGTLMADEIDSPEIGYSENEWETDLEETFVDDCIKSRSSLSSELYLMGCKSTNVLPSKSVLRQLKTSCLNLSAWAMTYEEFKAIMKAMAVNTSVLKLNLQGSFLDRKSIEDLKEMLSRNRCITEIDISENMIGKKAATFIGEILQESSCLETLNASGNLLDDTKVSDIANGIAVNASLKCLNLSHNKFMSFAGKALASALERNKTITELDLSWNHLRMEGAVDFALGLMLNTSLVVLNLRFNGFADVGAKAIGMALSRNSTLKRLDLSYNRITNDGATALSKGLSRNKSLRELNIGYNPISQAGSRAIIKAIEKAKTITRVDMEEIYVGESVIQTIQRIMADREDMRIEFRGIARSKENSPKEDLEVIKKKICSIIMQYLRDKSLRMLDLFNDWDKDSSLSLSPLEFVQGFRKAKIALSQDMLDVLIATLDKNNDGEITYTEFVSVTRIK